MRKLLVALLAVTFVCGLTMSASAADVKLTGSYYVKSLFDSNKALNGVENNDSQSISLTHQRLRVQPEVAIADGLKLVMRFDALEKVWGSPNWTATASYDSTNRLSTGNAAAKVQENIEFERAYVDFNTGYGKFMVGYQNFASWGTRLSETSLTRPGVKYIAPIGDYVVIAAVEKGSEYSSTGKNDADTEIYDLGVIKKLANGEAGILYQYIRSAVPKALLGQNIPFTLNAFLPYYKGTFGNVFVEGEVIYAKGRGFNSAGVALPNTNIYSDADVQSLGAYVGIKADYAPAYVGLMAFYASGDDPTTTDKVEGSLAKSLLVGQVASPTLMMWNDQFVTWVGDYTATSGVTQGGQFIDNAYFYYLYAGYKPNAKTDVKVAYAMATADKAKASQQSDYGKELDIVATYNIYDNLQYEVGAGYFWVGDFYKGDVSTNKVGNDMLLYHKLTLNF